MIAVPMLIKNPGVRSKTRVLPGFVVVFMFAPLLNKEEVNDLFPGMARSMIAAEGG
jgi:hypothetical protein